MSEKKEKMVFHKTDYPGVFYIIGQCHVKGHKTEKIFYIRYRKSGKAFFEKAGREIQDRMTAAQAGNVRALRKTGHEDSNTERREKKKEHSDRWTINRLFEHYQTEKTIKALDRESSRFTLYIQPEFGEKKPSEIAPLDIERFKKRLLKTLSPQTVKNTLELLRRIVNHGFRYQLSPAFNFQIQMPATDNIINESLNPGQIKNLLFVLNANPLNIESWLMKVMLYTGRRTGEVCKLEWSDIDVENQEMILRDPKAGGTQKLPFSNHVKEFFLDMPKFHDVYLFPNTDGSKRSRSNLYAKQFMLEAGIPDNYRPTYCLRHTFASVAASIDVPERALKALLGHASREAKKDITSRYAHVSRERLLQALNEIAKEIDSYCADSKVLLMGVNNEV